MIAMSKLKHPHQKHIQAFATRYRKLGSEYAFGGGGRICTAVHNNFQTTSTNTEKLS